MADKLGVSMDSFYGRILAAVAHADGSNLAILRSAFPRVVRAWEAWQAADGGDFTVPDSDEVALAFCGCEAWPGRRVTIGDLRAHKIHTMQAWFLWVMLVRKGDAAESDLDARHRLTDLWSTMREALDSVYPELRDELWDEQRVARP